MRTKRLRVIVDAWEANRMSGFTEGCSIVNTHDSDGGALEIRRHGRRSLQLSSCTRVGGTEFPYAAPGADSLNKEEAVGTEERAYGQKTGISEVSR